MPIRGGYPVPPLNRATNEDLWDAFAAGLKHTTGRSLDEWAACIQDRDLGTAIDFLKLEGLLSFQHASWIERWRWSRCNPYQGSQANRKAKPKRRPVGCSDDGTPYVTVRKVAQMAQVQAHALLLELQTSRAGDEILARECEAIYLTLCDKNGWERARWAHKNGVAHHLRQLSGMPKVYRDVLSGGTRKRLCVYPIPIPAPTPRRTVRRREEIADVNRMPRRQAVAA